MMAGQPRAPFTPSVQSRALTHCMSLLSSLRFAVFPLCPIHHLPLHSLSPQNLWGQCTRRHLCSLGNLTCDFLPTPSPCSHLALNVVPQMGNWPAAPTAAAIVKWRPANCCSCSARRFHHEPFCSACRGRCHRACHAGDRSC